LCDRPALKGPAYTIESPLNRAALRHLGALAARFTGLSMV
jgi:hypothetical protein